MLLNAGFYTELSHLNLLKMIKGIDNYACTLCGNSTETVQHVFISCYHSLAMWNQLIIHI